MTFFLTRQKEPKTDPFSHFLSATADRTGRERVAGRGERLREILRSKLRFVKVLLNMWWNLHDCKILVIFVVEKER